MEGNELNSVSSLAFMETVSGLSSDPLFCTIVSLCSLILFCVPHLFLRIVLSPVLIITGTLLLTLLRLGASQTQRDGTEDRAQTGECDLGNEDRESVTNETDSEPELGFDPDPCFEESFVEWDVRAPLEVIYEEYEDEDPNEARSVVGLDRHPTMSLYYPDSDSESSSDGGWDSPENICFRWDEEDREGMIEIALDGKKRECNKTIMDFQVEEENLIEIDISPSRIDQFPGEK